jgi:hypothetical protein
VSLEKNITHESGPENPMLTAVLLENFPKIETMPERRFPSKW